LTANAPLSTEGESREITTRGRAGSSTGGELSTKGRGLADEVFDFGAMTPVSLGKPQQPI
jgi:hypothetical protein